MRIVELGAGLTSALPLIIEPGQAIPVEGCRALGFGLRPARRLVSDHEARESGYTQEQPRRREGMSLQGPEGCRGDEPRERQAEDAEPRGRCFERADLLLAQLQAALVLGGGKHS